ncbi:MAG: cupin domain-containing protein [Mariprofundaceae bacterium]|nr:cupin domain-containing protein [Mariprofundaceae bacterium]
MRDVNKGNLFADIPALLPDEISESLLAAGGVRIERIVSTGQSSPEGFWYNQEEHEWVLLVAGSAGLEIEGEASVHQLKAGDFLHIPAHQRHRVAWTDAGTETIWLAVFFR